MSEPYLTPGAITQPKRSGWRVAIIMLVVVVIFAVYSYLTASGGPAKSDVPQAMENSTPPSVITANRTPTPTPVEYFDEDTARDLCWGQSLPGVQTSVPSGMSVYDGLGVDKGMRICMTPGEYALYQEAEAKWLAAEQVVRDYVTQNTYETAPMLLKATAAIAYLCSLDGASINQQVATRVVFNELASEGVDFDETLDAMCGDRFHPTPSAPRVYSPAPEPTSWPMSPEPEPGR